MKIIKIRPVSPAEKPQPLWKTLLGANIFESSATLSYYFLFSFFPFLILVSASFSTLHFDPLAIENGLTELNILPGLIIKLITTYIEEISTRNPISLIFLGLILTLYSTGKAVQTLKSRIRKAYHDESRMPLITEWIVSFVFVILMIIAFYATLILIVAGNVIIRWISRLIFLSDSVLPLLHSLRILLIAAFMLFLLVGIYFVLPGAKMKLRDTLPGSFFAMISWVLMSWLFAFYVDNMNDYSAVYGSLGAMIALLLWLYMINLILLSGAYINAHFYQKKYGVLHD